MERVPDFTSSTGSRAWRLEAAPREGDPPDWGAALEHWVVDEGVGICVSVALIHLRDIPGVRPADVRRPGATHEILMARVRVADGADPSDFEAWREGYIIHDEFFVTQQFEARSDEDAIRIVRLVARGVSDRLFPRSLKGRPDWGGAILGTAEHLRQGRHEVH